MLLVVGFLHIIRQQDVIIAAASWDEHVSTVYKQPGLIFLVLSGCARKHSCTSFTLMLTNLLSRACFTMQQAPASVLAICLLSLEESSCRCKQGAVLLLTMLAALLLGRGMLCSSPAALIICCLSMADGRFCILIVVQCCLGEWSQCRSSLQLVTYTGCRVVVPGLQAWPSNRAASVSSGKHPQATWKVEYVEGRSTT